MPARFVIARPDGLGAAVQFLHDTFPQLHESRELWYFSTVEGKYEPYSSQTIGLFVVPPEDLDRARRAKSVSEVDTLLLQAYVRLDPRGEIQTVHVRGRAVRTSENESLAQQVRVHEDWNQSAVLDRLRTAGAECVDKQRVLSRLPLESWRPMFGRLAVRDVKFDDPAERNAGRGARGDVYNWEVLLDSRARPPRRYVVTLEPFGCAVTDVNRTAPDFELPKTK